jgi:signal transduction histidine kinase
MFSKIKNLLFHKLSYRLTIAYLIFIIPSYFIVFWSFNYLAAKHLEKRDHEQIENQIKIYQDVLDNQGIDGLQKVFSSPRLHGQSLHFLIHITDLDNKTLYIHLPEDLNNYDIRTIEKYLISFRENAKPHWGLIPVKEYGDSEEINNLEVRSVKLDNGYWLSVGSATDTRDDLLENYTKIFLIILIPLIVFTMLGTLFVTNKILKPLQLLSNSIKEIEKGHLSVRSPVPKVRDELWDLTTTFNGMIQQIEYLVQSMKDTLNNIAHDLKTPLTRSRITSEHAITSNSFEGLRNAAIENIENTDDILKIVQVILTVARYDSNNLVLEKRFLSAISLIEEVVDLYNFVADEKKIIVEVDCSDQIFIFVDKVFIKQALANLLDNAIKYSTQNSVIKISCKIIEGMTELSISDTGIGISEADLPRIWERLFRADRSRHEPGLGLGLSLVKLFTDSHNCKIIVNSKVGVGSIFKIMIPNTAANITIT